MPPVLLRKTFFEPVSYRPEIRFRFLKADDEGISGV